MDFSKAAAAPEQLTVFRQLTEDRYLQQLALGVLSLLCLGEAEQAEAPYRELAAGLIDWLENNPEWGDGDAWQLYLIERILGTETAFSRRAAQVPLAEIGRSMQEMARADLSRLQLLYGVTSRALRAAFQAQGLGRDLPGWDNGRDVLVFPSEPTILAAFHLVDDWATLLEPLAEFYRLRGAGPLGRYHAFRWDPRHGLVGVGTPDPIILEDLVGYEYQRQLLLQNTEQFLAGYPSNNILLYGARGTGKSSLVKALLNAYREQGLRLVEVAREDLRDFPRIVRELRERPHRFILFADDLSFDDAELHYRELKAALEGSIEGRPENVLLYATSNRRHLIKERFSDRDSADDEIHAHDTAQEKLSLSDRFGLTLSFAQPTQAEYLKMVEAIARRRGLAIGRDELQAAALRWTALHNIPSGRTARQFVDDLQGRMSMAD